jgi:hypothetical protein
MNQSAAIKNESAAGEALILGSGAAISCPVSVTPPDMDVLTSGPCHALEDVGCPLASDVHHRLQLETLLTELSAKFVEKSFNSLPKDIRPKNRHGTRHLGTHGGGPQGPYSGSTRSAKHGGIGSGTVIALHIQESELSLQSLHLRMDT